MRLKEAFETYAPEYLKKHFPIRASSLEDFTGHIQRNGAKQVIAVPGEKIKTFKFSGKRYIADQYITRMVSQTPKGRKIILDEVDEEVILSNNDANPFQNDSLFGLRRLLTTEHRARKLSEKVPGVTILKPSDILEEGILQGIDTVVKENKLKPFPNTARQDQKDIPEWKVIK